MGLSTLALSVGEEIETVSEVAEPFLIREGLLVRTPRGRLAINWLVMRLRLLGRGDVGDLRRKLLVPLPLSIATAHGPI